MREIDAIKAINTSVRINMDLRTLMPVMYLAPGSYSRIHLPDSLPEEYKKRAIETGAIRDDDRGRWVFPFLRIEKTVLLPARYDEEEYQKIAGEATNQLRLEIAEIRGDVSWNIPALIHSGCGFSFGKFGEDGCTLHLYMNIAPRGFLIVPKKEEGKTK